MLHRWGMLNPNRAVNSAASGSVMVFCQVRKGGEQLPVRIEGQVAVHHGGYAIFGTTNNTGYPIITTDPKQRPLLARWSTLYTMIFMMGGNMIIMAAVLPLFNNEYSIPMLQATCLGVIVVRAILLLLSNLAIAPMTSRRTLRWARSGRSLSA